MDTQPVVIVSGSDDHYALPLAVTLHSALQNLGESYEADVYILDGGLQHDSRRRLERVVRRHGARVRLQWVHPSTSILHGLKSTPWSTVATYLRLLIPELLDASIQRVLYLDSDLLVEHDVGSIWEESFEGNLVLAVRDYWNPRVRDAFNGNHEVLQLDPEAPYFNAGVLLIDLAAWRDEQVADRSFAFVRERADLITYADQDGLNAVIRRRWGALDPRWNVMPRGVDKYLRLTAAGMPDRERQREVLLEAPHIWHFAGAKKPWKPGYNEPGRDRFTHYLQQSGWFDSSAEYRAWRRNLMVGDVVSVLRTHQWRLRKALRKQIARRLLLIAVASFLSLALYPGAWS